MSKKKTASTPPKTIDLGQTTIRKGEVPGGKPPNAAIKKTGK